MSLLSTLWAKNTVFLLHFFQIEDLHMTGNQLKRLRLTML